MAPVLLPASPRLLKMVFLRVFCDSFDESMNETSSIRRVMKTDSYLVSFEVDSVLIVVYERSEYLSDFTISKNLLLIIE